MGVHDMNGSLNTEPTSRNDKKRHHALGVMFEKGIRMSNWAQMTSLRP